MNDFIIPITEQIYFIKGERNGKLPYSNSILYKDHLIDTGISRKHLRKVNKDFLINTVFFSHWHEDHIRDNLILKNVDHFCHPLDKEVIENSRKFIDYYCVEKTPSEPLFKQYLYDIIRIQDTRVEKIFRDGQLFTIGNDIQVKVIHSPGHSAGHCCFYDLNSKIAFLGDIDLSSFGPWYGCLDSNLMQFEESIDKLLHIDIDMAISGHNGMVEGRKKVRDRLNDYKSIIEKREERILQYFSEKKPTIISDLVRKNIIYHSYKDAFSEYLLVAEKIMLQKHFEKFLNNGRIENVEKGYTLV
ncbi:MAG: MBL fold metallo-hydrolase [Promethearchaeota archaeon]